MSKRRPATDQKFTFFLAKRSNSTEEDHLAVIHLDAGGGGMLEFRNVGNLHDSPVAVRIENVPHAAILWILNFVALKDQPKNKADVGVPIEMTFPEPAGDGLYIGSFWSMQIDDDHYPLRQV